MEEEMNFMIGDVVYYHNEKCVVARIDTDDDDLLVLTLGEGKNLWVNSEELSFLPYNTPLWVGGWDGSASMVIHVIAEVREVIMATLMTRRLQKWKPLWFIATPMGIGGG